MGDLAPPPLPRVAVNQLCNGFQPQRSTLPSNQAVRAIITPLHSLCSLLSSIQPLPNPPVSSAYRPSTNIARARAEKKMHVGTTRDRSSKSPRENTGSPRSCQTSPPVCLPAEFGFYGTSAFAVFWVHASPGRSPCCVAGPEAGRDGPGRCQCETMRRSFTL